MPRTQFFGFSPRSGMVYARHVPNSITIIRIILTPVVLVLLFTGTFWGVTSALLLFVVAAASDWVDGKLARELEVSSRFGQFLDPLADKVLVLGTFMALAWLEPAIVPWWAVALIASRDVGVTLLRSWAEARGWTLQTLYIAKAKTAGQLAFLIVMLAALALAQRPDETGTLAVWLLYDTTVLFWLLMIVVAITLYTGVLYLFNQKPAAPADPHG